MTPQQQTRPSQEEASPEGSFDDPEVSSFDGDPSGGSITAEVDPVEVLQVATLGGGGIHHYVEHLDGQLGDQYETTIHDMYSDPSGSGLIWAIKSTLLSILAVFKFTLRRRPDIVHVHASQSFSFFRASPYILLAAYVWRRPVLLHVHGSSFDEFLEPDSGITHWFTSRVINATDGVIVLSAYWRDVLEPIVDGVPIHIVPNAVDPSGYDPQYHHNTPMVTFVSSLIERKGVPEFLEAVSTLSDTLTPTFDVAIAGDGHLAPMVEQTASEHDQVTYHGYLSESEKRDLLSQSSIFVLPSHAEGLPIALLEGMSGGNAVVSTTVGAIPEVVSEEGGMLIEPADTSALQQAIREMIVSPSKVAKMGQYNRRQIAEDYTWQVVTDRLTAIYDRFQSPVPDDSVNVPPEAAEETGLDATRVGSS